MDPDETLIDHLDLPAVETDDIEQEMALLRLQGKNPRKDFVAKRLAHGEAIFDEVPMNATLMWNEDPLPDPNVTEALIDWAFTQSEAVADATFDFLDDPTTEGLNELLVFLGQEKVQVFEMELPRERSLTQLITDHLPTTLEDLNGLARSLYPSARPEAAVRQVLRRLNRTGQITITNEYITRKGE